MNKPQILISSLVLISALFFGCNREQPPKKPAVDKKLACYQSISGVDTAWLAIDTAQSEISGTFKVNYATKMEIFHGRFNGKMYGDTIKGYFDFKINKGKEPFRNPLAFLKRDGKLIMGIGQFMTVMGTAHFDDKVPIDYTRARFIFQESACDSTATETVKQ